MMPHTGLNLKAEAINLRIRWFGLVFGFAYTTFGSPAPDSGRLNALLGLGLLYTLLDTRASRRGEVLLGRWPLVISALEAVFIGFLSYLDGDPQSPFRYYYFLSVICCAVRHSPRITSMTCIIDAGAATFFFLLDDPPGRPVFPLVSLAVALAWVGWASSALSRLLKDASERLAELNSALRENQSHLEERIGERTRELQETQAQLMHQDKMAGFGLLAAGIAHEVGNPLTAISSLIQLSQSRPIDAVEGERLRLISGELIRIQGILRELVLFSRPASSERGRCNVALIVREALGIAKYYKGTKSREIVADIASDLPRVIGIRDQLTQVIFNLVLNAIDATVKGGRISVEAGFDSSMIFLRIRDDGHGIPPEQVGQLFLPYFTTKRHGTGLGLFVSRKIVLEHGGTINCRSEVGRGSCFSIHLPRASISSADDQLAIL